MWPLPLEAGDTVAGFIQSDSKAWRLAEESGRRELTQ